MRISEIFHSFQGEGRYTGMLSMWIRFFGCNLECNGFGQTDPTDPSEWVLPYKDLDVHKFATLQDLPVFDKGCDSSYSWAAKYKHLVKDYTVEQVLEQLFKVGVEGLGTELWATANAPAWEHDKTGTPIQLCFTGGEPMLWQKHIMAIVHQLQKAWAPPSQITIETNATKLFNKLDLYDEIDHLHMSCSPKLYAVSGERGAIKPEVIAQYTSMAQSGVLKFVHNGTQEAWDELDKVMKDIRPIIEREPWDVWIMPVNSTIEDQGPQHVQPIVDEAMRRGYNISLRTHVYAFGNEIGR